MKVVMYGVIILACLVAPALTAFATEPYGIGLSTDSAFYISAAQNIAYGNGALDFNDAPFVAWPPFYPFMIAFVQQLFAVNFIEAAKLLNLALYAAIVALSAFLIKRHTGSLVTATLGAIATALFSPIFGVSLMVWSEMLFIALTLCLFVAIGVYVEQPRFSYLAVAALLTALLCLTRYTGVTVVGITAFFLIIFHWRRRNPFAPTVFRVMLYSAIALLPLAVWAVRNMVLSGTPFGSRSTAVYTPINSFAHMSGTFADWIFPINHSLRISQRVLTALLLLFLISVLIYPHKYSLFRWARNLSDTLLYIMLFSFGYTAFMFLSSVTVAFDPLKSRLLSPIAVPTLILTFSAAQALFRSMIVKSSRSSFALLVLALLWIGVNGWLSLDTTQKGKTKDMSINLWKTSDIITFLRSDKILNNCQIYSNRFDVVFLLLEQPAFSTPHRMRRETSESTDQLDDTWLQGEEGCVVWFRESFDFLYTLEDLMTTAEFTPIVELQGGGVYKVRKRTAP